MLPLPEEPFDLAETAFATINTLGCVRVRTNAYAAPLPAGTQVEVRLLPASVAVWHGGQRITTHERSYGRFQAVLDLEHYLDVLERKPGALAGSKPLEQWRRLGRWPASYDRFWEVLRDRHGRSAGTRAMVELLQLGRRHGQQRLQAAIEQALALGCTDAAAVRHLVVTPVLRPTASMLMDVGTLGRFDRPLPTMDGYDRLLAAGAGG